MRVSTSARSSDSSASPRRGDVPSPHPPYATLRSRRRPPCGRASPPPAFGGSPHPRLRRSLQERAAALIWVLVRPYGVVVRLKPSRRWYGRCRLIKNARRALESRIRARRKAGRRGLSSREHFDSHAEPFCQRERLAQVDRSLAGKHFRYLGLVADFR